LREVRQQRVDAAEANLLAGVDPALMQGRGIVRVSISNSRIFELRESVGELLHYPYGCVEQTTSSMLPWLGLRDFRTMLPELNRTDAEFQAAIEKGVARIYSMQTSDGGLAYWPGGHISEFWATAYGGLGLVMAKKAGFEVDEDNLKRVLDYCVAPPTRTTNGNSRRARSPATRSRSRGVRRRHITRRCSRNAMRSRRRTARCSRSPSWRARVLRRRLRRC
jgi:uncharacterized protein YfaS (alpha-2-macroglobulin family)